MLNGCLAMDTEFNKSSFTAVERQLILLSVSAENECSYCLAAHSTILKHMMHVDAAVVAAVRSGQPLSDAKQNALVTLTKELVRERGHLSQGTREAFFAAGYTATQLMEVLLGIALKTVSNYLDHISPAPLDDAFQPEA